ncbi:MULTISPECIES: DsbA family protein [Chryseobacterium]|jgi:predicted DsbA family dithiol-disulfide isomerase|uniref:DsbA family dithiol-disulfide isomerase n=1 Tax=Chryseobacterium geocarposphaerae TaxID=1416776 RepID=A0ABU1LI08_9FLAO|nr:MULTISPECIES: DsbA family protein [Chryseobacterium]MDR6406338.1 putative DsbA family dithiol-disulfide isomerase [Chryseobacterium geocarposphaerae]MDR6699223.1 putative DsbA family dithiol-disulfide isomerase [Chryseobacterium ginsenosidimutans]
MNKNPLLNCDYEKGVCEILDTPNTESSVDQLQDIATDKIHIIYYTDPICSSCWGIEPQLRKFKLEYGNAVEIDYRMGGLLPSWDIYNSGGISKPSDVAHHWEEVSPYYKMPIEGGVWLEDPLNSSYPPSIAFKAAQMQDAKKAINFMRITREMVFLDKLNITKDENLEKAAELAGLDVKQWKEDYESKAQIEFKKDLDLGKQLGVRGFPTLIFTKDNEMLDVLYGFKPYAEFEQRVKKIKPDVKKKAYSSEWDQLFAVYPTLTTQEFAVLSDISFEKAFEKLQNLTNENKITRKKYKNGDLWILNKN